AFGTTRKIDNLWSDDLVIPQGSFGKVRRFDRCTTCHQSIQKSLPGDATSPAYVGEQHFELVIAPPKPEELPKRAPDAGPATVEELLGIRFAETGLLKDDAVTVKFIRPKSPAARATVARGMVPGGEKNEKTGASIRDSVASFVSEPSQEDSLFPRRPGLMVGDVIEKVNGDEVYAGIKNPERVAALLADLVPKGQPIRLWIRRGLPNPYTS